MNSKRAILKQNYAALFYKLQKKHVCKKVYVYIISIDFIFKKLLFLSILYFINKSKFKTVSSAICR